MTLEYEANNLVACCATVGQADDGHGEAGSMLDSEAFDDDRGSSHWSVVCPAPQG